MISNLGLKFLIRDWRAGELRFLMLALILAIACIASIGILGNRIQSAMDSKASEFIGGDLVVYSSDPLPSEYSNKASILGLEITNTLSTYSVIKKGATQKQNQTGKILQLVKVKAAGENYPLKGEVRLYKNEADSDEKVVKHPPAPGTVWVQPRLLSSLGLQLGDNIFIGRKEVKITAVIAYEPDSVGDLFAIAPRIIMSLSDIPRTQIVQPGSRLEYYLHLKGEQNKINLYNQWISKQLQPNQRLLDLEDGRPALKQSFNRAQKYINLTSIINIILASITIAILSKYYCRRHQKYVALMRSLGASKKQILYIYSLNYLSIGTFCGVLGCFLGLGSETLLRYVIPGLSFGSLPFPGLQPFILAFSSGLILLFGFSLPSLYQLKDISPITILNERSFPHTGTSTSEFIIGLLVITCVTILQTHDILMALLTVGWILVLSASVIILLLPGINLIHFLSRRFSLAWRYAIGNIKKHSLGYSASMLTFGLIFGLLVVVVTVRLDLIEHWRQKVPVEAPNHFAINIQPSSVNEFQEFLSKKEIPFSQVYPITRGRLIRINKDKVAAHLGDTKAKRQGIYRPLNLTWTQELPTDNKLVSGSWWENGTAKEGAVVSIERSLAERLQVHLGDSLEFQIGDKKINVIVNNIRSVQWDNMRPNFYFIFPPNVIDDFPLTYMTSFFLGKKDKPILNTLVDKFPSVTVFEIDNVIEHIRQVISTISIAIEYLLFYGVLAGLVLFISNLYIGIGERIHQAVLLSVMGSSKRMIRICLLLEFLIIGLLSGSVAILASNLLVGFASRQWFDISLQTNIYWTFLIVGGSVILVVAAGLLSTKKVFQLPPFSLLKILG